MKINEAVLTKNIGKDVGPTLIFECFISLLVNCVVILSFSFPR